MTFLRLYRASFYLMLLFATLTLSVGATDSKIAMLYPMAVAVAAILAFVTVDRNPRLALSRELTNILAVGSGILVYLEWRSDPTLLLLALAHWLVYLQLVKMFLVKKVSDDWSLFVLGLIQVLVGAVISQSDQVGAMLITWSLLSLWVLGLFALHREALRARASEGTSIDPNAPQNEPYPGLLSLSFVFASLRVMATTLALGGVIFLAMPRRATMARTRGTDTTAKHLTGFDDEVQLGQLGEILENDTVVMTIQMYDEQTKTATSPSQEALLWRGVTMEEYREGRWHRQRRIAASFPAFIPRPRPMVRRLVQEIKLEATDSDVLFGLRPMVNAAAIARRNEPEINSVDGTIFRSMSRAGAYDYRVLSELDQPTTQPGELPPGPDRTKRLLALPEGLRPRLETIAREVLSSTQAASKTEQARVLEAYFRDSGTFGYTLQMDVVDPTIDPVEDFLVNRKRGHCEYFASALTLLLRSVGIPARMVNGFKGGDWNDLARVLSVRQKHAHSWVEAYLGRGPNNTPIWLTLDPTPANERAESVARVGGIKANFRQLTDLVRYIWVFYVVGYNADRQNRFLYQPIRDLVREARRGFGIMGQALRSAVTNFIHFRDPRHLISFGGFFATFTALLVLVGLWRGAYWLGVRLFRWLRGADEESAGHSTAAVHYRRLAELLAECGLERPSAETHAEFARRAGVFLTGQGSTTESVAEIPRRVVDAFYHVRFGHIDLSPEEHRALEERLDALETCLHPGPT